MAKDKKSFVLYVDAKETWEELTDEEAGKLIKHVFRYVNDENPTSDNPIVKIAFLPIKQALKRDLKKWEEKQEQRRQAGLKSAEARKRNSTTVNDRQQTSTVNVNGNGSVNGSVSVNIPSIEDIKAYTLEKGYEVDANKIWHYYNDNNWKDAKGKEVKNWKTKILNNWCKEANKIKTKPFSLSNFDIPNSDLFGIPEPILIQKCKAGEYPKIQA